MLQNKKFIRYQVIILSVIVSIFVTVGFVSHEYNNLKIRINNDILPSVVQELESLTSHTQNQFQFLRFTSLQNSSTQISSSKNSQYRPLLSATQPQLIDECTPLIEMAPEGKSFSNRVSQPMRNGDTRNGILLGNGDFTKYSTSAINLLCTVVTSSNANSEVLRLVKPHPIMKSQYYFSAKNKDYIFLYDRSFNNNVLTQYIEPKLKNQYENLNEMGNDLWITTPYIDELSNKEVITLVQNIKDYHNQVVGFLARNIEIDNLREIISKILTKSSPTTNLMDYAKIIVKNNNNIIFNHASSIDLKNPSVLKFEDTGENRTTSGFGPISVYLGVSINSMIKLIFMGQSYLIYMPFFIFIFSYMIFQQIVRGLREGDKQYFDSLTHTFNRHGLNQKVFLKADKAIQNNKKVHLFSLDANKFKQINDKYGHDMGDQAISLIAKTAQHICKPGDDIIRLGGDEFLIVLYIDSKVMFDPELFMSRFNQKLAYDCKASSVPIFTVSGGYVWYDVQSHSSFSQAIKESDSILLNKKSIEKIEVICKEFDSFDINLSDDEQKTKLDMLDKLNFIQAEYDLQEELNKKVLSAYHGELHYMISTYFKMMYSCTRENDNLHQYRMKIVESHDQANIPMSVFYFLFIKYAGFLLRDLKFNHDELVINNRLVSYELHFVSSLRAR